MATERMMRTVMGPTVAMQHTAIPLAACTCEGVVEAGSQAGAAGSQAQAEAVSCRDYQQDSLAKAAGCRCGFCDDDLHAAEAVVAVLREMSSLTSAAAVNRVSGCNPLAV